MEQIKVSIKNLYEELAQNFDVQHKNTYDVIYPENYEIRTLNNKFVKLIAISKHKTTKHLIKIYVKAKDETYNVVVTTDHVCMVYTSDHFFDNVNASNLNVNDYVSVHNDIDDKEYIGTIIQIDDLGETDEYVYDCEVDDDSHAFYANDIAVHNSQFVNIQCVTNDMIEKQHLNTDIADWSNEKKLELWNWLNDFVENDVNGFVQNLIKTTYHTEHPEILRYSLEYIAANGIYEAKKHYCADIIVIEGPELKRKVKFSGIELKKATVPPAVKDFLKDIYLGVLQKKWDEHEFVNYIHEAYDKFKTMSINDIAIWKGYNTAREASGFLQMELGATGISKACTYYNQLIEHLSLNKKYDNILVGQKVRFSYVIPSNEYGIECIAFHDGQWPEEFDKIFKVDYDVMFDKLVSSPLKGFLEATKFKEVNPQKQVVFDIFDL